jgi:hypothetical protein
MPARMIVETSNGDKILIGGRGAPLGLSEVSVLDEVRKASSEQFKKAMGSLGDLVAVLEEAVGRIAHRPEKVEMEFKASLTGECDLWIVSGEGEAEFTVKLAWEKGK